MWLPVGCRQTDGRLRFAAGVIDLTPTLYHRAHKQENLTGPNFVCELWELRLMYEISKRQIRSQETKYVARDAPLPPLRAKACGAQEDCTETFAKPEPRTARATTGQLLSSYFSLLQFKMPYLCLSIHILGACVLMGGKQK